MLLDSIFCIASISVTVATIFIGLHLLDKADSS